MPSCPGGCSVKPYVHYHRTAGQGPCRLAKGGPRGSGTLSWGPSRPARHAIRAARCTLHSSPLHGAALPRGVVRNNRNEAQLKPEHGSFCPACLRTECSHSTRCVCHASQPSGGLRAQCRGILTTEGASLLLGPKSRLRHLGALPATKQPCNRPLAGSHKEGPGGGGAAGEVCP